MTDRDDDSPNKAASASVPTGFVAELKRSNSAPDLGVLIEDGVRAGVAAITSRASSLQTLFWQAWTRLSLTLPGLWTQSLVESIVSVTPIDVRDIRVYDMKLLLRALDDGARTFAEVESAIAADAATFAKSSLGLSPVHGRAYGRDALRSFATSARLRAAWHVLRSIGAVAISGQPDYQAEVVSVRWQRMIRGATSWGTAFGAAGKALARAGERTISWETSLSHTRLPAVIAITSTGRRILADPRHWFRQGRLPIAAWQSRGLLATFVTLYVSALASAACMSYAVIVPHAARHVRPSLVLASVVALIVAIVLAVFVSPQYGSFWSELLSFRFIKLPLVDNVRASHDNRASLAERQRNGDFEWTEGTPVVIASLDGGPIATVVVAVPDAESGAVVLPTVDPMIGPMVGPMVDNEVGKHG